LYSNSVVHVCPESLSSHTVMLPRNALDNVNYTSLQKEG
jgi:hypothetical protein